MTLVCLVVVLGLGAGCAVDETAQVCHISTDAELEMRWEAVAAERATEPTSSGVDDPVATTRSDFGSNRQVLQVIQAIPAGLAVRELIEAPTVHLSARAVPQDMTCPTTISSVAQLRGMNGETADVRIEAGQFLDMRQFGPRS